MSKYHEKPDCSPRMIHESKSNEKRFTLDFGERRRVDENCKKFGIKKKKKHRLAQQRKAMQKTKEYYEERCDDEILNQAKTVVREALWKQYKETEE